MEEEECRKIIAAEKRSKEVVVKQTPRAILRPDTPVPSKRELMEEWKLIEEACAEAQGIARKRLEAEGERCRAEGMAEGSRGFLLQLLEIGRRTHRAKARREEAEKAVVSLRSASNAARANLEVAHDFTEARREEAKKVVAGLHLALDATRAYLEVARDDAEGILLSKHDLERVLASGETEAGDLRLQKFGLEASV